jgi:hypothetical protein
LHRVARQGRTDPIQFEVIARNLNSRIRLQAADRSVSESIRYLECTPDIVGPPPRDEIITIEDFRGRLRIVKDDTVLKEVLSAHAALEFLHMKVFEYSIGDRPEAAVLHAACLRRNGRRLLLAGTKGAGKSTLVLRLIAAGYEMEGDEHVFVQSGTVIARPRACRVKEASLQYLPEKMAEIAAASPCYHNYDGERIFNVDPRALGFSWRIEEGKVDQIFVLRPNHGGYSSIRPLPPSALVQYLMPETGWRERDAGGTVEALAKLASNAKAFDLSLGEHTSAIRCVEAAIAG